MAKSRACFGLITATANPAGPSASGSPAAAPEQRFRALPGVRDVMEDRPYVLVSRDFKSTDTHVRVKDVETGRRWSLGLGKRARTRFETSARQRREDLSRAFYRVPMDHVFVPTDKSPVLPVLSMFARRMSA